MKKFIITGASFVTLAVPAVASASPGYSVPETASCNGAAHGTHGFLGAKGERPNLGQGDVGSKWDDGKLGASPLTGPSNKAASQACKTVR
jgi:hypothetical protein